MNPKLQKLFDRLEADRVELLVQVEMLTEEQFQKSVNGKWSIQQILRQARSSVDRRKKGARLPSQRA